MGPGGTVRGGRRRPRIRSARGAWGGRCSSGPSRGEEPIIPSLSRNSPTRNGASGPRNRGWRVRIVGEFRSAIIRVKCPWKAARRRRRLRQVERLGVHPPAAEVAVYVDEVDIHLNPKVGPDWMRRGRQKEVLTPGCNAKCDLAGAWDPRARRLVYVEGERKTSLLFLELLHKLVTKTYPDARR